eukprot:6202894-Pleurochrysis_carterae.AAC.3
MSTACPPGSFRGFLHTVSCPCLLSQFATSAHALCPNNLFHFCVCAFGSFQLCAHRVDGGRQSARRWVRVILTASFCYLFEPGKMSALCTFDVLYAQAVQMAAPNAVVSASFSLSVCVRCVPWRACMRLRDQQCCVRSLRSVPPCVRACNAFVHASLR